MTVAVTPQAEAPAIARAPSAPFLLPFDPELVRANFPADLRSLRQWVFWNLEHPEGKKKPTKVPYSSRGSKAKTTVPETWSSLEDALAARLHAVPGGVGFVFAGNGQVGIDLDHCRDRDAGAIAPWAKAILDALSSYSEVSPSGTGVHVLVRGALSGAGRKRHVRAEGAHPEAAVEVYDRGRYFTVTGRRLPEYPAALDDRQEAVERLYASMAEKPKKASATVPATPSTALPDDEVLRHAFAAKNGPAFLRLWNGDTQGHGGDDSAADLALCGHLSFWCRGDAAQMDRLFRQSRLYREKWDRQDYRERTLAKALEGRTEFYEPARHGGASSTASETGPVEPWEAPVPFDAVGDLPAFPTDALPSAVADWVHAEATSTQTPEDLPGMIALAVLATAVAKKFRATIRSEWREPLCLYIEVTLPPGERKSAVFRDATAPLIEWEREAISRDAPRLREAAIAYDIAEGRLKEAKGRAIKAKAADRLVATEEVRRLGEEMATLPRPVLPRLLADDVTPERLFGILAEQGGRLGILSPEGGIFDLLAGRYSDGLPNLDAFLKAHAGDQLRVDRIGRPAEHLREPTLTVGLAVQPVVLEGLADKPGFRGRGLLARFLYSIPRSKVGHRLVDPPPVPTEVAAAYAATVQALLNLPATRGEDGEIVSVDLSFSPEALQALLRFSAELEPRLGEGGDLEGARDWAAKLPGAVARIAGVLALADGVICGDCGNCGNPTAYPGADLGGISGNCGNSGNPSGGPAPVTREAVERAILLGHHLIPHALSAFGIMGTKKEVEDAKYLLRWILKTNSERFTKREAWQGTRGRFEKAEDLDLPLHELEARGYIRQEPVEGQPGRGRPASPRYAVNPLTCSHNSHNPQKSAEEVAPQVSTYSHNSHNSQKSPAEEEGQPPAPPSTVSPKPVDDLCPHCAARPGEPHWRGRESACPRAEPLAAPRGWR